MSALLNAFRVAWGWLRKNPVALASAISAAIGAWLVFRSRTRRVDSLESALEIKAHTRKIAQHETKAAVLMSAAEHRSREIRALRVEIARGKRRVVEIHNERPIPELSDVDVAAAFTRLGY